MVQAFVWHRTVGFVRATPPPPFPPPCGSTEGTEPTLNAASVPPPALEPPLPPPLLRNTVTRKSCICAIGASVLGVGGGKHSAVSNSCCAGRSPSQVLNEHAEGMGRAADCHASSAAACLPPCPVGRKTCVTRDTAWEGGKSTKARGAVGPSAAPWCHRGCPVNTAARK